MKMERLIIKTYIVGYIETNMYLISHGRKGIIIDPGFIESEADRIIKKIKNDVDEVSIVLLTHCHFDHISGTAILKKEFNSKIYCHKFDAEKLSDVQKSGAAWFGVSDFHIEPDCLLEDGQEIESDDSRLRIIHTPGHTGGGLSILLEDKYLFSGDTLFKDGIGRTDLYDGDYDTLMNSIKNKLLVLPENIIVYPGHGPSTTIGKERKNFGNY